MDLSLPAVHSRAAGGRWLSPDRVVFPDLSFPHMPALAVILERAGIPIANAPPHVVSGYHTACPNLRYLSPAMLRKTLLSATAASAAAAAASTTRGGRHFSSSSSSAVTAPPRSAALATVLNSSVEDLGLLLEYCLLDVRPHEAHQVMAGLPLLPLANGQVGKFSIGQVGRVVEALSSAGGASLGERGSGGEGGGYGGWTGMGRAMGFGRSGGGGGGTMGLNPIVNPVTGSHGASSNGNSSVLIVASAAEYELLREGAPHLLIDRQLAEQRPAVWAKLEAMADVAAGEMIGDAVGGEEGEGMGGGRGVGGQIGPGTATPGGSSSSAGGYMAGGGAGRTAARSASRDWVGLTRVSLPVLAALMPLLMPPGWQGQLAVDWQPSDDRRVGGMVSSNDVKSGRDGGRDGEAVEEGVSGGGGRDELRSEQQERDVDVQRGSESGALGEGIAPAAAASAVAASAMHHEGGLDDLIIGQEETRRQDDVMEALPEEGPSLAWIQKLWAYLSSLPPLQATAEGTRKSSADHDSAEARALSVESRQPVSSLAPIADWPIVPTCSRQLRRLDVGGPFLRAAASSAGSAAAAAAAAAAGSDNMNSAAGVRGSDSRAGRSRAVVSVGWSDNLMALFTKAGVHVLRPDVVLGHPDLSTFLHDATAAGVVEAIADAATASAVSAVPSTAAGRPVPSPPGSAPSRHRQTSAANTAATRLPQQMREVFTAVSAAERRELRSFLCQSRWFPAPANAGASVGGGGGQGLVLQQRMRVSFLPSMFTRGGLGHLGGNNGSSGGGFDGKDPRARPAENEEEEEEEEGVLLPRHIEMLQVMPVFEAYGSYPGE